MAKGKNIAVWTISILLAAVFLFAGSIKLIHSGQAQGMFVQYGYPAWFAIFIGACEVLGAIGLLVRWVAVPAAAGLIIIMAGAIYTHVSHQEASHAGVPIVLLILLLISGYLRLTQR